MDSSNKNQGFSLPSVLVSMGLLGVLAVGVMQLSQTMTKSSKSSEVKAELVFVQNQIVQVLLSGTHCNKNFKDKVVPINANSTPISITQLKRDNGTTDGIVAFDTTGTYGNGQIKISSMQVEGPVNLVNNSGSITLKVTFERLAKSIVGGNRIIKEYPLYVETVVDGSDNKIVKCYSSEGNAIETAKKEFCLEVGGTLDADDKCQFSSGGILTPQNANQMLAGAISGWVSPGGATGGHQYAIDPGGSGQIYKRGWRTGWSGTGKYASSSFKNMMWNPYGGGRIEYFVKQDEIVVTVNNNCDDIRVPIPWMGNDWGGPSNTQSRYNWSTSRIFSIYGLIFSNCD
jgi:type II secretory pathway pseudopilin PulG